MKSTGVAKSILAAILVYSIGKQLIENETWWFIQTVNLVFHEAGHVMFMLAGRFLATLGGSVLEIVIPLIIMMSFAASGRYFSAAFGAWWLATACLSVSIYAADAQERNIQLITNDISSHDWHNILTMVGLLKYDDLFGYLFYLMAVGASILIVVLTLQDKDVKVLFNRH